MPEDITEESRVPLSIVRENAGYTPEDMAHITGLSVSTINRIERGTAVTRPFVARYCAALNLKIEEEHQIAIKESKRGKTRKK